MKVSEFAKKYKFRNSDKVIVEKLYGNEEKSEQEWDDELKGKIAYEKETAAEEAVEEKSDIPSKEQKIEEIKNKQSKNK